MRNGVHFKFRQTRVYPGNGGGSELPPAASSTVQGENLGDCDEDDADESWSTLCGEAQGEKDVAVEEFEVDVSDDEDDWRCCCPDSKLPEG